MASAMNAPSRSQLKAYGGNVGAATYAPLAAWFAAMSRMLWAARARIESCMVTPTGR
jgi:hypothetical protein